METNELIEELLNAENCCDASDMIQVMLEAADALESQQKRIAELEAAGRWVPGKKPPEVWKDENGDAINFLAVIPGIGVDIANWIEPTRCWFCMGVPCKVTHWMPLPEPPKEEI